MQHDINIKEGIIAIKLNIFMLQREIITVTDVFEKYNICKDFFYILLLYMKMTFCPAETYFLHKLNDMFIFQVQCAIRAQLISE
jgi:hypothetical protein